MTNLRMTNLRMTRLAAAALLALGAAGCAPVALDEPDYDVAPTAGLYGGWDTDASGALDGDEFYTGVFDTWDTDDDGLLSEEEFGLASQEWFEGTEVGLFEDWDADGSGLIEDDEFFDGIADVGV